MKIEKNDMMNLESGKFTLTDYIVFSLMLIMSIMIGLYSAFFRNNSTKQEFLAGGKSMPVIPVALSLVGGAISAISILGKCLFDLKNFHLIDIILMNLRV